MKGFALGLALKWRQKATRKWPQLMLFKAHYISSCICLFNAHASTYTDISKQNLTIIISNSPFSQTYLRM